MQYNKKLVSWLSMYNKGNKDVFKQCAILETLCLYSRQKVNESSTNVCAVLMLHVKYIRVLLVSLIMRWLCVVIPMYSYSENNVCCHCSS